MIKKLSTALAVVIGVIALSATPADARPIVDPPVYNGPAYGTSHWFAGRSATGCVGYGVFSLKVCR
jgi:hypothetical protein